MNVSPEGGEPFVLLWSGLALIIPKSLSYGFFIVSASLKLLQFFGYCFVV
jgi:hypothetical protein